ncbi:MAG: hypothetical protein OEW86_00370 [Nitrosopumilus sp.]|nr:hypothetical protein [Nitrosopumilus sp.]
MSNIKWTKKRSIDKKLKSKKKVKISPSNIIYTETYVNPSVKKVFIVKDSNKPKNKMKKISKKVQKASASNCNIKQGFKRPGR